jgi:hypothetical protein
MSTRAQELAHRRESLRLRAAAQRAELAFDVSGLEQRLSRVDQAMGVLQRIARNKPLIIGLGTAIVALLGPRRLLRWGSRGVIAASTARRLFKALR